VSGSDRAVPQKPVPQKPVPQKPVPQKPVPQKPEPHRPEPGSAGRQELLFGDDIVLQPEDLGYRGPTACAAAGITYRQLDYWARTGLVEPSVRAAAGSGSQRLYGFRDILVLKVVKRLLDTGISLQQIRAAVTHLRERGSADLAEVTLMSDGVSVYECTSPDEVVDLLQGGQGVFGIALGRVWQEVEGTLAELPAERAGDEPGSGTDELASRRVRKTG
jgi:DNA-binding transcriptional MerR regulator